MLFKLKLCAQVGRQFAQKWHRAQLFQLVIHRNISSLLNCAANFICSLQERRIVSAPEDTSAKESSAGDTECDEESSSVYPVASVKVPSSRLLFVYPTSMLILNWSSHTCVFTCKKQYPGLSILLKWLLSSSKCSSLLHSLSIFILFSRVYAACSRVC